MNCEEITWNYYSQWTGFAMNPHTRGVFLSYNPARDETPQGYSRPMNVYVFAAQDVVVVSYGTKAKETLEQRAGSIQKCRTLDALTPVLSETFATEAAKSIKYRYTHTRESPVQASVLHEGHSALFLDFFKANHPKAEDYSWVQDYFMDLVSKHYCHGIIVDHRLVSATDAPDMPCMGDAVQEIGIYTIQEYRGHGYARSACISFIQELLSKNVCPLWSTGEHNSASDRLAKSIGFEPFAEVLSIEL